MKVIDPGHLYELYQLDQPDDGHEDDPQILMFVKRVGPEYPGNEGPAHHGVTTQEVLRALIDRMIYVENQKPYDLNEDVIRQLRACLYYLEWRAAELRGEEIPPWGPIGEPHWIRYDIENEPTCSTCGHIRCSRH